MTARAFTRLAAVCRHYFAKQGGTWTCTMRGETR